MFFVGDYQQRKPRRTVENKIARLNIFILACHIAVYAFAVLNIQGNISSTTESSFTGSSFTLVQAQLDISIFCETPIVYDSLAVSVSRFGQKYEIHVDNLYSNVLWARCLEAIITALTFNGVLIFLSILNKVWFEFGRRFIRIRSITISQNVTITAQLMCAIFCFISITHADAEAKILREWLKECDPVYGAMSNAMNALPNIPLYVAVILDVVFQFLAFCAHLYYGHKHCRLDYEIIDVDGEQVATKRPSSFMINGLAPKSNRHLIEALLKNEGKELEEVTLNPGVIEELERNDRQGQGRRRKSGLGAEGQLFYPYASSGGMSSRTNLPHNSLPIGLTTMIQQYPGNSSPPAHLPLRRDRSKNLH